MQCVVQLRERCKRLRSAAYELAALETVTHDLYARRGRAADTEMADKHEFTRQDAQRRPVDLRGRHQVQHVELQLGKVPSEHAGLREVGDQVVAAANRRVETAPRQ